MDWVSDLFVQDQKIWNVEILMQLFPMDQVEAITSIYIPQDESVEDKLIWLKTKSGKFTTKSCYKLLADNIATTSTISSFPWKQFWKKMKTQPKIHTFAWKVLHNGLVVFSCLARFNNHIHNICSLCNSEEESVNHLLFSCQFSKVVFQASPLSVEILDGVSSMDIIQNWLSQSDQGIMLNLGSCILWNIWKMRNDIIFNNIQ